ncbi:mandelate racemase [Dictyobacter sp. S3.2.2.5]|uniref:Mandelate racemase n=1 Tax=Dictyobacter halimunensis TaxID=3026934 RepID=A0ABQ6FH47_9CHLR|nr:mandelate racemase [Dictyobacter sp. S3.2.2.5]
MKIREIHAIGLRGGTPEGGWSHELKPDECVHTLLVVRTDEDLFGLGSVFSNDALVRSALEVLAPLYTGENALEPERVSEKLHQHTFWLGRGGTITHTISGIDIALWDLLGKATGQPVGRLLGGYYRDRVRPYASLLIQDPDPLAEELLHYKMQGFRAFKIGWGDFGRQSDTRDETIVRAAREAIGEDALLMVDAGGSDAFWNQGYKWALRTAQMLADYKVTWFEEPLRPDAMEDYALLRRAAPLPISSCEVLTRRQSFLPWLQTGAVDIVQPDVTKVGGLSESRRIGWFAQAYGIRLIPHGWNTAVGLTADLHLAAALSDTDLIEYKTGSPYIDEIAVDDWHLDAEGMLSIPRTPGLGLKLDVDALIKYTASEALAPELRGLLQS